MIAWKKSFLLGFGLFSELLVSGRVIIHNYPRSLSESFKQNSGPPRLIDHYDLLVRTPSDETPTLSIFRTAPAMKSHVSINF